MLPSIITLSLKNKANLMAKSRSDKRSTQMPDNTELQFYIRKLNLSDYQHHYDKEKLKEMCKYIS